MHPILALRQIRDLSDGEDEAVHQLAINALLGPVGDDLTDHYLSMIQRVQRLEAALEEIYHLAQGAGRHEAVDVTAIRCLAKANLPAGLFLPAGHVNGAGSWAEWQHVQAQDAAAGDAAADLERRIRREEQENDREWENDQKELERFNRDSGYTYGDEW